MRPIAMLFLLLVFVVAVILPNDIGTISLPAVGVKAATKARSDSVGGNAARLFACVTSLYFSPDRIVASLEFQALQVRGTAAGPPRTSRLVI